MEKRNLMQACESLKYDIIRKLKRFVRDNGEEVTSYHRNEFGLDVDEDDGHIITKVLNFYDNGGCHFFEPDSVNNDGLKSMTPENYNDLLYENTVYTSYQCLYIVEDFLGIESLHYYRFTNGGLMWDDDQAEPDHGDCISLTFHDLHYILEAINENF